jgi:hypothetical protein
MEATTRQQEFIRDLIEDREMEDSQRTEALRRLDSGEVSKTDASRWIDRLKELPRRQRQRENGGEPSEGFADVPPGRYALPTLDGDDTAVGFYRVDRPDKGRWAGYTFVKQLVASGGYGAESLSQKRLPVPVQKSISHRIAENPWEAMERFGRELGACGNCGRALTNRISRALGIGPVCGRRLGYITPERLAEARAFLEAEGLDPDEEVEPGLEDFARDQGVTVEEVERESAAEVERVNDFLNEAQVQRGSPQGVCPLCGSQLFTMPDSPGMRVCEGCGETFG